jgi:diguanylate cyclase (GGDEF)-like protein
MRAWQGLRRLVLGQSIRGRGGRALILAGLAPILAMSFYVATSQRADLAAVANENLATQARLQAAAVQAVLDQAEEAVAVLAANPTLRGGPEDEGAIAEQLEAFKLFEEVTLLHPMGVVIEATSYGFAGRWDANAAFRGALEGRSVMSPPVFYSQPERLVVEFAAPVYRGSEILAVVVGSMNMNRVWRVLDAIAISQTGFFVALDKHSNVIAHPDKSLVLRKLDGYDVSREEPDQGSISLQLADGSEFVGHEVLVGASGWRVVALQENREAYALADATAGQAAIVALLVLVGTLAAASILSRAISGPMRTLGEAMRRVAEGDLAQRVSGPGLDEIDTVAESFNVMVQKLEQRSDSLKVESAERDRAEQQIRYQAYHDPLTGLPNRMLLADRLDMALADSRRTGEPLAVLYIDLDRFKSVNDSAGHAPADTLLQGVSDRILGVVREGDSLARVGGDEYVLLLPRVLDGDEAVEIGRRIQRCLLPPWELGGREYRITASLGIAMSPRDGADAETLLRNADTAMYAAKDAGRNSHRMFSSEMDASIQERASLEQDLRKALPRGEFALHYQPQVVAASGRIIGMEALLRWHQPQRGLVPPVDFISVAEETGLISDIGKWVLETAAAQIQAWNEAGLVDGFPVAVNVSARQFQDVGFTDTVRAALELAGLSASQLELEITEGTAMRDIDHSVRTLAELKKMGVRVSIDDFGTGYSSLSYLKRFPIDTVKIDRSFIADITRDADDAAIVEAIVAVASSLNMGTIAEGVETEGQLAHLRELGCELFQGFLFSQALPPAEFAELLVRDATTQSKTQGSTRTTAKPELAFGT